MNKEQLIFIFILCIFIGCNKNPLPPKPEISITNPIDNSSYTIYDTIRVNGTISSENTITQFSVVLQNEININVLPEKFYYPEINAIDFEIYYPIDNISLESGTYYLRVQAIDENHIINLYIKLQIGELQKALTAYGIIRKTINGFELDILNLLHESIRKIAFNGNYKQGVFNSLANQFAYITGGQEIFYLYNLNEEETIWEYAATSFNKKFTDLKLYKNHYHFIQQDGSFSKVDINGVNKLRFNFQIDTIPNKLAISDEWISILNMPGNSPTSHLVQFLYASSAFPFVALPTMLRGEFIDSFEDKIVLSGPYLYTDSEDRFIDIMDPEYPENDYDMQIISQIPLIFCQYIGNDLVLFANPEGIFEYNINNRSSRSVFSDSNIESVYFEPLSNQVFIYKGTNIASYNYYSTQLLNSIPVGEDFLDMVFIYNK